MNVLMMTNVYPPDVNGVARSVETCSTALREIGHQVRIVAPMTEEPQDEGDEIVRVPAVHHVTANDIPVRLPLPGYLWPTLTEFQPDIVHVHHPFLLGSTALRLAATWKLPVVFTYHTMYEHYTHNLPIDSAGLARFTVRLATDFSNLCDHVVAPSQSVKQVLRSRGVWTPISVVPTGIDPRAFGAGDGPRGRAQHGIPPKALVVGHVGRLTAEKNLEYLTRAMCLFLQRDEAAHSFIVGDGPLRERIAELAAEAGVSDRLHLSEGALEGPELCDAYAAMDFLAFASQSETQGMVLAEAMAAGLPVVALDASGARDIVRDYKNGRLLAGDADEHQFAAALDWMARHGLGDQRLRRAALRTADRFSIARTVRQLERVYARATRDSARNTCPDGVLPTLAQRVREEYHLWSRIGRAMYDAAFGEDEPTSNPKAP